MCLECGYYNGRQVMDLQAQKAKREARMKEKAERIKAEIGSTSNQEIPGHEEKEKLNMKDDHKKVIDESLQSKRPDKHRESKSS
jgi:ribosomal protein L44E